MEGAKRTPAKRRRGGQPTHSPERFGGVASALLLGDSVEAACASSLVPSPTYQYWRQRGEAALNLAREAGTDDIENVIWDWIHEGGGFGNADGSQWYWHAEEPEWWPLDDDRMWPYVLFTIVTTWARGKAEQIYRTSITRAANGDPSRGIPADWRAAQFMLTHSFGWRNSERLEVTGKDGGPIETTGGEDRVLELLDKLANKAKVIDVEVVQEDVDG